MNEANLAFELAYAWHRKGGETEEFSLLEAAKYVLSLGYEVEFIDD